MLGGVGGGVDCCCCAGGVGVDVGSVAAGVLVVVCVSVVVSLEDPVVTSLTSSDTVEVVTVSDSLTTVRLSFTGDTSDTGNVPTH